MHEPDYTEYSLAELQDCLDHLNSERYPERLRQLQLEIALRQEQGESLSEPLLNELLAEEIPLDLGIRAFCCFFWRIVTAGIVCALLLKGIVIANSLLAFFSPLLLQVVLLVVAACFMTTAGTVIMMQVLAKRYQGYRLRIVKHLQHTRVSSAEQPRQKSTAQGADNH